MRPEQAAPQSLERSVTAEPVGGYWELEGLRAARERHRAAPCCASPAGRRCPRSPNAVLPLDVRAPAVARSVVTGFLRGRVSASVLDKARLAVSELVTNSGRHSGVSDGVVVVGIAVLTAMMVRLEVADPGRAGVISPRPPDGARGGGFGLHLMQSRSEWWGLERVAAGGTCVWAQLLRIRQASGGDPPREPEEGMP